MKEIKWRKKKHNFREYVTTITKKKHQKETTKKSLKKPLHSQAATQSSSLYQTDKWNDQS